MAGRRLLTLVTAFIAASTIIVASGQEADAASGTSVRVTWTCTGSPCPSGLFTSSHAIVWPSTMSPTRARLGYTTSAGVYLSASQANGLRITVDTGSASVYAGAPRATSHRLLGTLSAGRSLTVSGLSSTEVLSVLNSTSFSYTWTQPVAPTTTTVAPTTTTTIAPTTTTTIAPTTTTTVAPTTTTVTPTTTTLAPTTTTTLAPTTTTTLAPTTTTTLPPATTAPADAQLTTWTCTSSPCPWGGTTSGWAAAWAAPAQPVSTRLGYTTSAGVYLPAIQANGLTVTIDAGTASLYAGAPQTASHRLVTTLSAGQSHTVAGLAADEVLSIQSGDTFRFRHTVITTTVPTTTTTTTLAPSTTTTTTIVPTTTTTVPPAGPCTNPVTCNPVDSIDARWRCALPGCTDLDWTGAVVSWPSWAAYSTNNRTGYNSRVVYSTTGEMLYPYMGPWADGCRITPTNGQVLVIEWQRGTDVWRETYVNAGETYTIDLVGSENGAMLEANAWGGNFRVSISNCTPQPVA